MSTILSTSKLGQIPYTVLGGRKQNKHQRYPVKMSLLVLNRQSRIFKQEMFDEFQKAGFDEIVSLESDTSSWDLESLTRRYPMVRFIKFHSDASSGADLGQKINICFEEAHGRFICVIWNDLRFRKPFFSPGFREEIFANPVLCRVPRLLDTKGNEIPSLLSPAFFRNSLKIIALECPAGTGMSIYPFDYTGIFDKEKFLLSGGFDPCINNPYWQLLDFGFRNFMWGEQIISVPGFRLEYTHDPPAFDASIDAAYCRFYLKNLAVRFHGDTGRLSGIKLFKFLLKSGGDYLQSFREFRSIQSWVYENRYRFVQDAVSVTDLWSAE